MGRRSEDIPSEKLTQSAQYADNKGGKPLMSKKNQFALSDADKRLIKDNALYIRQALFSCATEAQVECAIGFARFLSSSGLNGENYWLFLRLVMTNNKWVLEEILRGREPRLLFSTIKPSKELVEAAFQTLYSYHPQEIIPGALEAILGVVENCYFDPDDGYRIRKLTITDINALGKFLDKDKPQDQPGNRLILQILDRIAGLNEYYQEQDKSVLSKHAFDVRFAYFDSRRRLVDAIPHPLLAKVRGHNPADPEADFAKLVIGRRKGAAGPAPAGSSGDDAPAGEDGE